MQDSVIRQNRNTDALIVIHILFKHNSKLFNEMYSFT